MNKQLTEEEAKAMYEVEAWKDWTDEEIVAFQLFQDRLCVPFGKFRAAVEQVLGRPVWIHEFAQAERLRVEYLKERPMPSFEEILALVLGEKIIVVM